SGSRRPRASEAFSVSCLEHWKSLPRQLRVQPRSRFAICRIRPIAIDGLPVRIVGIETEMPDEIGVRDEELPEVREQIAAVLCADPSGFLVVRGPHVPEGRAFGWYQECAEVHEPRAFENIECVRPAVKTQLNGDCRKAVAACYGLRD